MSEHTKGEWKLLPDGLTIKAEIEYKPHYDAEPPQTFIAKCFQNGHLGRNKRPTEEDLANAHLIAAAPDLLAACKYTENLLSKGIGQRTHALALIESAIAKTKKE